MSERAFSIPSIVPAFKALSRDSIISKTFCPLLDCPPKAEIGLEFTFKVAFGETLMLTSEPACIVFKIVCVSTVGVFCDRSDVRIRSVKEVAAVDLRVGDLDQLVFQLADFDPDRI